MHEPSAPCVRYSHPKARIGGDGKSAHVLIAGSAGKRCSRAVEPYGAVRAAAGDEAYSTQSREYQRGHNDFKRCQEPKKEVEPPEGEEGEQQ